MFFISPNYLFSCYMEQFMFKALKPMFQSLQQSFQILQLIF